MLISAPGSKPCIQDEKCVKHVFNNSILSFKTILIQSLSLRQIISYF